MTKLPDSHINNALTLTGAEPEIDLFELTPSDGSGTIYFKNDNDVTYRGTLYKGLPLSMSGDIDNVNGGEDPRLTVGDSTTNLAAFKPLILAGGLDGAILVRRTVLLANMLANNNFNITRAYRCGVSSYSRTQISMVLRRESGTGGVRLPHRAFTRPAFPYVVIG